MYILLFWARFKRQSFLFAFLKEQYPVTVHAPDFDFWTGCRELKRCEASKTTLKNPFASRLAEFNTALNLLRITDQWYVVLVKFWFGEIEIFRHCFYYRWPEDQKMGSALMLIEGLFLLLASKQAQIIGNLRLSTTVEWLRLDEQERSGSCRWWIASSTNRLAREKRRLRL